MSHQSIEHLIARKRPGRKVQGIAATLLPYQSPGKISVESFQQLVVATHLSGLMNAVNMDTGYVNFLSGREKQDVLEWTRQALGERVPFVAGAYIENQTGDLVSLYRAQVDEIVQLGGVPILFQTARLHGNSPAEKAKVYEAVCRGYDHILAFELSPRFAPNGEIFDDETFRRMLDIPEIKGMKHSSLDRQLELKRLLVRDTYRPDFRIYTGNDLAIDMIEYGSDYLLGLATFAPERFAERDRCWALGDPAYYALSDALQYLGNVAFREPLPAYKHSAAIFLHAAGRVSTPMAHPRNPERPAWEVEILNDCARRLGGYDQVVTSRLSADGKASEHV